MKDLLEEQISLLEDKVNQIYFAHDFETADKFKSQIDEIKRDMINLTSQTTYMNADKDMKQQIWDKMSLLGSSIDMHLSFSDNDRNIRESNRKALQNKIDMINNPENTKNPAELIEELKEINDEINKNETTDAFLFEEEQIGNALINIFIRQIHRGEPVSFGMIEQIMPEGFEQVVQKRLIDMARIQDETKSYETLKLAQNLTSENLKDESVWQVLSDSDNVKLKNKDLPAPATPSQETALAVPKKKNALRRLGSRMAEAMHRPNAECVIVNEDGLKETIKVKFPIRDEDVDFLKKNCTEITVNNMKNVSLQDIAFLNNLKKVTFGKNVQNVDMEIKVYPVMREYNRWKEPYTGIVTSAAIEEIILSDDVKNVWSFEYDDIMHGDSNKISSSLKRFEFGNGITKIPQEMFAPYSLYYRSTGYRQKSYFSSLKEVKLPKHLSLLGTNSFYECDSLEKLDYDPELEKTVITPRGLENAMGKETYKKYLKNVEARKTRETEKEKSFMERIKVDDNEKEANTIENKEPEPTINHTTKDNHDLDQE